MQLLQDLSSSILKVWSENAPQFILVGVFSGRPGKDVDGFYSLVANEEVWVFLNSSDFQSYFSRFSAG